MCYWSAKFSHRIRRQLHAFTPDLSWARTHRTLETEQSFQERNCTIPAMTQVSIPAGLSPQDDLRTVVETRTREWHFHIYFLLQSPTETAAALALRDAVLRLRRDGESMLN